LIHKEKRLW